MQMSLCKWWEKKYCDGTDIQKQRKSADGQNNRVTEYQLDSAHAQSKA